MSLRNLNLAKIIEFLLGFHINCSVQVNGKQIPAIITYLLLIAGARQAWRLIIQKIYRGFFLQFWCLLKGSWTGQSGSGYLGSIIQQSSIFHDSNWPSMKQIFRAVLRKKIALLDLKKQVENQKKHVIVYGACSHIGSICSSIFIKYGFSVILIDPNL